MYNQCSTDLLKITPEKYQEMEPEDIYDMNLQLCTLRVALCLSPGIDDQFIATKINILNEL
jgi:hypothetical protein